MIKLTPDDAKVEFPRLKAFNSGDIVIDEVRETENASNYLLFFKKKGSKSDARILFSVKWTNDGSTAAGFGKKFIWDTLSLDVMPEPGTTQEKVFEWLEKEGPFRVSLDWKTTVKGTFPICKAL